MSSKIKVLEKIIMYKLKKRSEGITMQSVKIYEMLDCKMVSSGTGMFGEGNFNIAHIC